MRGSAWMPRIDRNLCIGCGECVAHCPTQALSRVDDKSALTRPDACTYCAACESLCPVGAIELPYLICRPQDIRGNNNE
jgi:ferredoxin